MERFQIRKPKGATKAKKILGRGAGSGHGSTAGRGDKGQNSRAGGGVRPGFEGGQMPLFRRIARRGFSNYRFRKKYLIVKVEALNCFNDGERVDRETLRSKGLIGSARLAIKIIGNGDLARRLAVAVEKVSAGARSRIEAAGGSVGIAGGSVGA